jgi:glycosyl transferase family 1
MRVLMLGANVASQISITVRALRRIGIDAEGVVNQTNPFFSRDGVRNLALGLSRMQRLRRGYLRTSWSWNVATSIARADLIHWNYGDSIWGDGYDVRLAHLLRRPAAVEFWGSDMRIAELAERDNPYYTRRGNSYEYEHVETKEGSFGRQALFGEHGVTTCFAPPWFERYIKPGLFRSVHDSFLRILPDEFEIALPANARRPVIVHAPSARAAKGTAAVERAVERLRQRFDFEFVLLHGITRQQVLETVRRCDVFLDQFVIGEYGMASLEAMAFGKPVLCYLRPDVVQRSPGQLPIVNATQDTLEEQLGRLLGDAALRRSIGEASRRYVESHHDAEAYARRLVAIYEQMLRAGR